MGNRPLEKKFDLLPLKNWMDGQNFKTLYDILMVKEYRIWLGWSIGDPPTHLLPLVLYIFYSLKG
jgi:hypothetical protein